MSDKIYICLDTQADKTAKSLFFVWQGTSLGVKREGDSDYEFVDLKGDEGNDGNDGNDGVTPNFQIGTVESLNSSLDAYVNIEGTKEYPILNLGIPRGKDGKDGTNGKTPTKGVDYFTATEINSMKTEIQEKVLEYIDSELTSLMESAY